MEGGITGVIMDIDHFAAHDGPGIRACVYLKGCPLRCAWCHSPESQRPEPQLLYAKARCVDCGACAHVCPNGLHTTKGFPDRRRCADCGLCASVCQTGALRMCGCEMRAADVAGEVLRDIAFFKNSGGGVTLSGGEVLYQPLFALEILKLLKEAGVHTIVETSGFGKEGDLLRLVPYTDCFYYDYKLSDKARFISLIGTGYGLIASNLIKLREVTNGITLRVPLIPGITDTRENLYAAVDTAVRLGIREMQLLPYNPSAGAKYEWIGRTYGGAAAEAAPDPPGTDELTERAAGSVDIKVVI